MAGGPERQGGRRMLGPVSNEDEGAGSGTDFVWALLLGTCVRAVAGADACGRVVALSGLCGHVGYPGGVHPSSKMCGCICWR